MIKIIKFEFHTKVGILTPCILSIKKISKVTQNSATSLEGPTNIGMALYRGYKTEKFSKVVYSVFQTLVFRLCRLYLCDVLIVNLPLFSRDRLSVYWNFWKLEFKENTATRLLPAA